MRSGLLGGTPRLHVGRGGQWVSALTEGWRHFQPAGVVPDELVDERAQPRGVAEGLAQPAGRQGARVAEQWQVRRRVGRHRHGRAVEVEPVWPARTWLKIARAVIKMAGWGAPSCRGQVGAGSLAAHEASNLQRPRSGLHRDAPWLQARRVGHGAVPS